MDGNEPPRESLAIYCGARREGQDPPPKGTDKHTQWLDRRVFTTSNPTTDGRCDPVRNDVHTYVPRHVPTYNTDATEPSGGADRENRRLEAWV